MSPDDAGRGQIAGRNPERFKDHAAAGNRLSAGQDFAQFRIDGPPRADDVAGFAQGGFAGFDNDGRLHRGIVQLAPVGGDGGHGADKGVRTQPRALNQRLADAGDVNDDVGATHGGFSGWA